MHVFYKLNFKNGFYYYGVTNNMQRRLHEHKQEKKKYDLESHEIIKEFQTDVEAYEYEKQFVSEDTIKDEFCLNQTRGGRHPYNCRQDRPHTQATKDKISASKRANPVVHTTEFIESVRQRMLNDNPSKRPEVRHVLSEQKIGDKNPQFGKVGTMKDKKHTDDARSKMSIIVSTPTGIFQNSTIAAEANRCCQQSVMNRCYSDKEKWKDWKIVSIGSGISKKKENVNEQ